MSLRLRLLNLYLRGVQKPQLARMVSPQQMRAGLERAARLMPSPPAEVTSWSENAGENAPRMAWRRYGPAARDRVILYFHGGAFVAGSPETHESVLWTLSRASGAPVTAPDYRLAPEHPFPAGFDDCVAAYEMLCERGFGPGEIALAGDSAGGGLAFAVAAEVARRGLPRPAAVLGFSPFLDLTLSGASLRRNARREQLLPVARIPDVVELYLAGATSDDPRASPLFAPFQDPPPALLQVGSGEALRDDSARMAERLRAAGGDVRLELWRGAPHAFQFFAPLVPEARKAVDVAGAFARACFERAA